MYETFEHTADLGLRIRAADLNSLFEEAGKAMFSVLVDDLATVEHRECFEFERSEEDKTLLLFDWLNELLYRHETEHVLFSKFQVRVRESAFFGSAWGEPFDSSRHVLSHEVKAITYHQLRVEAVPEGWLAEVIVDI